MSNAVHVVCPQCGQINRIPEDRLVDGPSCGGCKQGLFPGKPIELTGQSFARFVAKSDLPVVVDFWAPWCGPCKMMAPVFNQVAAELSPRVILAKVNTEAEQRDGGVLDELAGGQVVACDGMVGRGGRAYHVAATGSIDQGVLEVVVVGQTREV